MKSTIFLEKGALKFEIQIFFANAFESTLPLPKLHDLSSRWLGPGLAVVAAPFSLGSANLALRISCPSLKTVTWILENTAVPGSILFF